MKKLTSQTGFTLIELLVVLAVFGILSVMVSGAVVNIFQSQRDISRKEELVDDVRSTLDVMNKEITSGANFTCINSCSGIAFYNKARDDFGKRIVAYRYNATDKSIEKAVNSVRSSSACQSFTSLNSIPSECFARVTSANVEINNLSFDIANDTTGLYPIVSMAVDATVYDENEAVDSIILNNTISPRTITELTDTGSDAYAPWVRIVSPIAVSSNENVEYTTTSTPIRLIGLVGDSSDIDDITMRWENPAVNPSTGAITNINGSSPNQRNWQADIPLTDGSNLLRIFVTDGSGNERYVELLVRATLPPLPLKKVDAYRCYYGNDRSTLENYDRIFMPCPTGIKSIKLYGGPQNSTGSMSLIETKSCDPNDGQVVTEAGTPTKYVPDQIYVPDCNAYYEQPNNRLRCNGQIDPPNERLRFIDVLPNTYYYMLAFKPTRSSGDNSIRYYASKVVKERNGREVESAFSPVDDAAQANCGPWTPIDGSDPNDPSDPTNPVTLNTTNGQHTTTLTFNGGPGTVASKQVGIRANFIDGFSGNVNLSASLQSGTSFPYSLSLQNNQLSRSNNTTVLTITATNQSGFPNNFSVVVRASGNYQGNNFTSNLYLDVNVVQGGGGQ